MAEEIKLPIVPEFPTAYGETEQQRLDILAKQKTQMEELYQAKFSEQAWSRVPFPEKAVRGLVSGTVFEPLISAVTPWQWGFDYGLTPEEAQKKMLETEAEYSELLRMQRVVTILPSIQNTLRALALTDITIITTREELDKYFKLSTIGFTEEEQAYVVDFARSLLATPKEDLVSGESLGLHPITPEEIESLIGGDRPIISPSQILSTVAFSTDLDQIQQALQQAYPPIAGEIDATKGKEVILQEYLDALKNLGVDTESGLSLPEMASQAFDIIGESKGWVMPTGDDGLPLIDPATNQTVVYVIDKDSYAWYGESIIGYYDERTQQVAPVSIVGEPLLTDEQQESVLKDWRDAAYLSLKHTGYSSKQWITNSVPMMFIQQVPGYHVEGESLVSKILNFNFLKLITEKIFGLEDVGEQLSEQELDIRESMNKYITENNLSEDELGNLPKSEQAKVYLDWAEKAGVSGIDPQVLAWFSYLDDVTESFNRKYMENEQNYIIWLTDKVTEHPELLPRTEWDEPMIERLKRNPKELLDVGYLGYNIMSNLHTYIAVAASIGVTFLTKNPLAGMGIAMAMFTPLETESLRQDLMASGATYEQATKLSPIAGTLISSLESIGNVPVLRAIAPQFFAGFKRRVISNLVGRLVHYGVVTPAKIGVSETLEEILQEVVHNAFVTTVDEDRHLLENIPEVALQALLTTIPLAYMGTGGEYINMKNYLNKEVREQLEANSARLQENGIPKDQADLLAYNSLASTETGQAHIDAAMEDMAAEIPHTKWDTYTTQEETGMTWDEWESTTASTEDFAAKITNLESEIDTLNKDIENQESLLEERETKLAKLEVLGTNRDEINKQQEIVTVLKEQLQELEVRREKLITNVIDLRRAMEEIPPSPVAVEPAVPGGIPMPDSARQELLSQADAWLEQTGKREPNALHVIGIPEGEALIRTDSEGKPMMVVTLLMREDKLTLSTIVSEEPGKLANGKALLDIINYLKPRIKSGEVFFPPRVEMSPDAIRIYDKIMAKMAAKKTGEPVPTELTFEETPLSEGRMKLPRGVSWNKEQSDTEMAVKTSPDVAAKLKLSRAVSEATARAERDWQAADEEHRLEIAKKLKLGKSFISKDWAGMSGMEHTLLTAYAIPDGSIDFKMFPRELVDMEEFCEYLEEATGLPFLTVYRRATNAKSVADATAEYIIKEIQQNPRYRTILKSEAERAIVAQELNARNEIQGVEHPETVTEDQLALVDELQGIYDAYKPYARYLMFMRTKPKIEALKERFRDAVKAEKESELITALELRNKGDLDGLWEFLHGCDWGVIEFGFDPRQMASPNLQTKDVAIGTVRGADSLEKRTRIEFPEGRLRRDVVSRMIHYVTQMEIQWHIEPELRNFEKLWKIAYWKFSNKDEVKINMNRWWGKMQGIPSRYGKFDRVARRVWRQAMTSIFIEPVLSIRNCFQAMLLHMDRSELIRLAIQPLSPIMKNKGKRYYDIFVSQLGGLRKYMLLVGQPGLPGLGKFNQIADAVNVYGWSDYLPRLWSFMSYLNKANRATKQFLIDGNIDKWIKNSGALHLRQTERNYVLSTYLSRANDLFNLQVDALEDVTGAEMATFFVAQRNTDRTHFKYRRELRSGMEMGNTGETLWNLFVFPRGYGQRVYFQAEKIAGLFKGETTWQEARGGFNDLIKLFVVAQLFSSFWSGLTGRKRNPYDPFSILTQWTFGGLFVGAMIDITELISDAATSVNVFADPTMREQAQGRIPGRISDTAEMIIPFFKRIIDIWGAVEDTPDQDVYWMRKMKELWDDTYTQDELEKLDMTLWERMKKATLGATPADPEALERAQTLMLESRDKLGIREITGRYYTLGNHASVVASATKGFPNIFTSDYAGSHELDIFFKDCEAQWEDYYMLPTSPSTIRKDWRLSHVEEEAMMLFWEKFSQSVFPIGSQEWEEVARLLLFWFSQYRIDQTMHKEWANWGLDLTK